MAQIRKLSDDLQRVRVAVVREIEGHRRDELTSHEVVATRALGLLDAAQFAVDEARKVLAGEVD